jgi:hypothetical protein
LRVSSVGSSFLAGEKRFDRRESGVSNVAWGAGEERVDRRVSFVFEDKIE